MPTGNYWPVKFSLRANLVLMLLVLGPGAWAQKTGEVDYPYLGIKFTIPAGWKGEGQGDGFLIASDTQPGWVFMMAHGEKDLTALKQAAEAGLYDEEVSLQKSGGFDAVGQGGIGAEFVGTIQGQPAKAYVVGIINTFGQGVSIISATSQEGYTDEYKKLARDIALGIRFYEPVEPPITKEWRDALKGAKLTYMKSSYSSGGVSVDGYSTYSGYSSHKEIALCASGAFSYYSSSNLSVDTGGAFAGSAGSNDGLGKWNVSVNEMGVPMLNLEFNDGKVYTYELGYEKDKTYLNGDRYFRTYDNVACN